MFYLLLIAIFIGVSQQDSETCIESMSWPLIMDHIEDNINKHNFSLSGLISMRNGPQEIPLNNHQIQNQCSASYILKINNCLNPPSYIDIETCNCPHRYETRLFRKLIKKEISNKNYLIFKSVQLRIISKCGRQLLNINA